MFPEQQRLRTLQAAAVGCSKVEWADYTDRTLLQVSLAISLMVSLLVATRLQKEGTLRRLYYLPMLFILLSSGLAYFAMSSDMGWIIVPGCRQFFWVRYLDLAISYALVFVVLGMLAGAQTSNLVFSVFCVLLWTASLLLGAMTQRSWIKWGWWFLGLMWFAPLVHLCGRTYKIAAFARSMDVGRFFSQLSSITIISAFLYQTLWMFAEGYHSIPISVELLSYIVIDFVSRVVFCLIVLARISIIDLAAPSMYAELKSDSG